MEVEVEGDEVCQVSSGRLGLAGNRILVHFDVELKIEENMSSFVWCPSGGELVGELAVRRSR